MLLGLKLVIATKTSEGTAGSYIIKKDMEMYATAPETNLLVLSVNSTEKIFLELCYNIRYPEQVGRNSEYPWVLRHMAVCQIYSPETISSKWIILQPSRLIESKLENVLQDTVRLDYNVAVNLMILTSTEAGWRAYINHLESEINSFVSLLTLLQKLIENIAESVVSGTLE